MRTTETKVLRCKSSIVRCNMRLQTFIRGTVCAPTDKYSDFCKRAAQRQLRHIVKLAELVRYYQRGGNR